MLFIEGCEVEPLMLSERLIRNDLRMSLADVSITARPFVCKSDNLPWPSDTNAARLSLVAQPLVQLFPCQVEPLMFPAWSALFWSGQGHSCLLR
jgi:hypothetical protein